MVDSRKGHALSNLSVQQVLQFISQKQAQFPAPKGPDKMQLDSVQCASFRGLLPLPAVVRNEYFVDKFAEMPGTVPLFFGIFCGNDFPTASLASDFVISLTNPSTLLLRQPSTRGKWIAFTDLLPSEEHARIYLLSTETSETRRILISPNCAGEGIPPFSHNGEYLAYWCFRNYAEARLYSLPLPDGKPKMVAPLWARPTGLTWSADDKKLVYARWTGEDSSELGEVTVANGSVKRLALEGSAECPAQFVPVEVRQTGTRGAEDGARQEA